MVPAIDQWHSFQVQQEFSLELQEAAQCLGLGAFLACLRPPVSIPQVQWPEVMISLVLPLRLPGEHVAEIVWTMDCWFSKQVLSVTR